VSALGPSQGRLDVIGFLLEVTFMLMTSVHSSPVPIQLLQGTLNLCWILKTYLCIFVPDDESVDGSLHFLLLLCHPRIWS
jgi:hypothetical protein